MKAQWSKVLFLVTLLVGSVSVSGCGLFGPPVKGSGEVVTVNTSALSGQPFSALEVSSTFFLSVKQGESYSVVVKVDKNIEPYLLMERTGDRLSLRLAPVHLIGVMTIRAEVTVPSLKELRISGRTSAVLDGFATTSDMDLRLSGASKLSWLNAKIEGGLNVRLSGASTATIDAKAASADVHLSGGSSFEGGLFVDGDANFELSGASTVKLKGLAVSSKIDLSGASKMEMKEFCMQNVDARLSGASYSELHVQGRLSASLSGASKLLYVGEPKLESVHTSGASRLLQSDGGAEQAKE